MYRSSRKNRTRKLIIGAAAAALLGGAFAVSTGLGQAATENCAGLDTALSNNLSFIAGQKAAPDAQSEARIANRQAVVDLIQQRRATAGCTGDVAAGNGNANGNGAANGNGNANGAQGNGNGGNGNGGANAAAGEVVCQGVSLTFTGEGGAPFASSSTFPDGTLLNVLNLDNNKSTTVEVKGKSGSCILMNATAFEAVREQGKNLIRRNVVTKVSGGAAAPANPPAAQAPADPPLAAAPANPPAAGGGNNGGGNNGGGNSGDVVCAGSTVTLSGEGGAPGAASGTFPLGTTLKVTNLDNNKATTVKVTSTSGSCILLNNAAFEQVREPGKFLIRRAVIEKIG
jgi:hypothetical protein